MPLTLYHNPQSRSVMIHVLLEELGVPYRLVHLAFDDESMRAPEFLAINPMGKVPTLVDGDTVVTEGVAIALYLADKYKTPRDLAPSVDHPARGEYLRWMVFQTSCIEAAMTQAGAKFEMRRQQAGWGNVDVVAEVLQQRLAQASPYLLGDWFTAADVMVGLALGWAIEFSFFPKVPELVEYVQRVQARPAFQRVMAAAAS